MKWRTVTLTEKTCRVVRLCHRLESLMSYNRQGSKKGPDWEKVWASPRVVSPQGHTLKGPHPPKTVPPSGYQIFKHTRLWGHSSLTPWQNLSCRILRSQKLMRANPVPHLGFSGPNDRVLSNRLIPRARRATHFPSLRPSPIYPSRSPVLFSSPIGSLSHSLFYNRLGIWRGLILLREHWSKAPEQTPEFCLDGRSGVVTTNTHPKWLALSQTWYWT